MNTSPKFWWQFLLWSAFGIAQSFLLGQLPAQDKTTFKEKSEDAKRIQRFVDDLGSDDFATRQSATKSLIAEDAKAIPSMIRTAFHDDAETRARAIIVLQTLSKTSGLETRVLARHALSSVSQNAEADVALKAYYFASSKPGTTPDPDKVIFLKTFIRRHGDKKILDLSRTKVTEDRMRQLLHSDFQDLHTIEAHGTKLDDEGLRHFKKLKITKLGLHSTKVTDAGIAHLKKLPIKELSLGFTKLTDKGLADMKGMPLESLMLARTKVTDAGMKHAANLPLKSLNLVWVDVSDKGLSHLEDLKLESLSVTSRKVTDAGLKSLSKMPLKTLLLGGTSITDKGLQHLTDAPLQILWLYDTKVTDAALPYLLKMKSLQTVYIQDTKFSEAAAKKLRKKVRMVHTGR